MTGRHQLLYKRIFHYKERYIFSWFWLSWRYFSRCMEAFDNCLIREQKYYRWHVNEVRQLQDVRYWELEIAGMGNSLHESSKLKCVMKSVSIFWMWHLKFKAEVHLWLICGRKKWALWITGSLRMLAALNIVWVIYILLWNGRCGVSLISFQTCILFYQCRIQVILFQSSVLLNNEHT